MPSIPVVQTKERPAPTDASSGNESTHGSPRGAPIIISHEKQASVVSSDSVATVRDSLKRKKSNDTVTGLLLASDSQTSDNFSRGITLDVGIPCVISWKRARFKGYARYIGELEGETGPWVGVEVPVSDSWTGEKIDGQAWNDGSWGGIKYFDVGVSADWEFNDDRLSRRRRFDWVNNMVKDSKGSLKREGDQLSIHRTKRMRSVSPAISDMSNADSRGLFVRPQHVLYVMDAVESEL